MRNHRVERALAVRVGHEKYRAIDREGHRQQKKRQARRSNQADDKTVALESPRKGAGPGVLLVCLRPDLSEHLREVELELVRRRVLTRVVARAAAVAEVGEISEIGFGEGEPPLQRRKDRAIALAIATRIANARHTPAFVDQLQGNRFKRRHGARPPRLRCDQTPCRWPCRFRRCTPCPARCRP